jgi:hypothetical protein
MVLSIFRKTIFLIYISQNMQLGGTNLETSLETKAKEKSVEVLRRGKGNGFVFFS